MTSILGVPTFHPRAVWEQGPGDYGGPLRRDDSFTRRPPLGGLATVTRDAIHYTGAVDVPDGDPDEILAGDDGIRNLLRNAHYGYLVNRTGGGYTRRVDGRRFPGYPLGYSFAYDYLGGVWEIAGFEYRPAATNGHNSYTRAHLFLTDGDDPATPEQWASFRAMRRELIRRGSRSFDRPWPHRKFREETGVGTSTSCCGAGLIAQIDAGLGDLNHSPPTDPTPPGDDDMATAVIWKDPRYKGSYLLGVGTPMILTPELKDHYQALGVPEVEEEHDPLLAQCVAATGYTPPGYVPPGA